MPSGCARYTPIMFVMGSDMKISEIRNANTSSVNLSEVSVACGIYLYEY